MFETLLTSKLTFDTMSERAQVPCVSVL